MSLKLSKAPGDKFLSFFFSFIRGVVLQGREERNREDGIQNEKGRDEKGKTNN